MSKAEVLAELPRLSRDDLAEVQARLDELIGDAWDERADLTDADKSALDVALDDYARDPNAGEPWEQVRARIESQLRP